MKRLLKNITHYKSSILGVVFIVFSLSMINNSDSIEQYEFYLYAGLIVSGVLLLFVPDKFINALEKKVLGKNINLFKSDNNE